MLKNQKNMKIYLNLSINLPIFQKSIDKHPPRATIKYQIKKGELNMGNYINAFSVENANPNELMAKVSDYAKFFGVNTDENGNGKYWTNKYKLFNYDKYNGIGYESEFIGSERETYYSNYVNSTLGVCPGLNPNLKNKISENKIFMEFPQTQILNESTIKSIIENGKLTGNTFPGTNELDSMEIEYNGQKYAICEDLGLGCACFKVEPIKWKELSNGQIRADQILLASSYANRFCQTNKPDMVKLSPETAYANNNLEQALDKFEKSLGIEKTLDNKTEITKTTDDGRGGK